MYQMKLKRMVSGVLATALVLSGISIMPYTTSADVLLVDNTFEINYDGWTHRGDLTSVVATPEAARDSARGMLVSNRLSPDDGSYSEKGFYLDGGKAYDYSVWVRHDEAADENFNLRLRYYSEEKDEYTTVPLVEKSVASGEWTELATSYTAPSGTINLTLILTTDTTADFCFDDVKVVGKKAYDPYSVSAGGNVGLKDVYAKYFRFGTCMPKNAVNDSVRTGIVLREFNSVTCENEMKPDNTVNRGACSNNNVAVTLSDAASILDFCIRNNIAVRGHTFVWYSQTPDVIFKQGFNSNGAYVSASDMDQRLESYIKNMFDAIKTQYSQLNLYAYDVCNELFLNDGGGMRPADNSNWVRVYGNDSFVLKAFEYARKYAPANCKLYINDYNEYMDAKTNDIYNMAMKVKEQGNIDGIGMQAHLDTSYPNGPAFRKALDKFLSTGLDVQVTELDITNTTAEDYQDIVSTVLDADKTSQDRVTALVVWGTTDSTSWRSGQNPLLFDGSGNKKGAYNSVFGLVPSSDYGDGNNPNDGSGPYVPPEPIKPDENGYYFHTTFEDGLEDWSARGDASVSSVSTQKFMDSKSASVSDRSDTWHGIARSLSTNPFEPGTAFSFSAMAMYETGEATETFKLTLQYTGSDGEDHYDEVATAEAKAGKWVQLKNTSFTIPEGAMSLVLYVETVDTMSEFYVDEIIGAVDGTVVKYEGGDEPDFMLGDIIEDSDNEVNAKDLVALAKYNVKLETFDARQMKAANVYSEDDVVDSKDLVKLAKFVAKLINTLD